MIIVAEPSRRTVTLTGFDERKTSPLIWNLERSLAAKNVAARLRDAVVRMLGKEPLEALSFRLPFGDESFISPVRIDGDFTARLAELSGRFPLHIPSVCALISLFAGAFPDTPQFAYFETSFFAGLPAREKRYPLAEEYCAGAGILKQGFHGIFHGAHAALPGTGGSMISVVLDRHTTVCAVKDGKPVAVSLGSTPLEGIMSARSCGDIDPGIIVYLMKEQNLSLYKVDELLKNKSGFFGMTGYNLATDELITLYEKDDKVTLAFEVYKNQVLKYIGDYITELEGFDSIVFGGRYTPRMGRIIYALVKDLSFLGVSLARLPWDPRQELCRITSDYSRRHVYINTLDETDIISRSTRKLLKTG